MGNSLFFAALLMILYTLLRSPFRQMDGDSDGFDHAAGIGLTLLGDLERCAVSDAAAEN